MSVLKVFSADNSGQCRIIDQSEAISVELASIGVRFETWKANETLAKDAVQEDIISVYRENIDALMAVYGFQSVDVISLNADHPEREALRAKFLAEHVHTDFEVRFFVEGQGLFYLHVEDKVYGLMCRAGDLVSVPAQVKHWFDMGKAPSFKCIRLFTNQDGWVANYTKDTIAQLFPSFEEF